MSWKFWKKEKYPAPLSQKIIVWFSKKMRESDEAHRRKDSFE